MKTNPNTHAEISASSVQLLRDLVDLVESEMIVSRDRRVPEGGDKRASLGYWQSHSFLHKLQGLSEEAKELIQYTVSDGA